MSNKIFMAQLGKPTDEPAVKRIQEAFPDCEVYPIKYAHTLTRLGGGLHCVSWNTVQKCYQNAKVFKPSKRHPFNPFDENAFTEERLRAVREHDLKRKLEDDEWKAFDDAFFKYWNRLYELYEDFSPDEMFDSIKEELTAKESPYFSSDEELTNAVNILITYMMHVPKLILPENTDYNPREVNISKRVVDLEYNSDDQEFPF